MARLSKNQIKLHSEAEEILKKDVLTYDEKIFVYENWNEAATNNNAAAGAFFTPLGLAQDFSICLYENAPTVDLCAGIGILSFFAYHFKNCPVTCIEINPDYVRVGKKLLPEATWINASIFDQKALMDLPIFKQAISNPPFGRFETSTVDMKYKGNEFEFLTIEIASKISEEGTLILPQQSTPFKYSGNKYYEETEPSQKLKKFLKETEHKMSLSVGIDTGYYINSWKGVNPMCEIVDVEYSLF